MCINFIYSASQYEINRYMIYKSEKVLPYVYMCVEKSSGRFYIGYRHANKFPSSEDFGKIYFTSNEYVKKNFDLFDHYIVAEFFNKRDALSFESKLIAESRSPLQINNDRILKTYSKGIIKTPYNKREEFIVEEKKCALNGCNNVHKNWRMKCCCLSHQKQYAAYRSHIKT